MASVLVVGSNEIDTLESSYCRAMQHLGWDVHVWTPTIALRQVLPTGPLLHMLTGYLHVEPWLRKANRDLILQARDLEPDLLFVFPNTVLLPGALAQLKVSTAASLVCVWPDTLANLNTHQVACLPLYDLVATYSQSTVAVFLGLGAGRAEWIPLAGDPHLHPASPCAPGQQGELGADVTFIGGWRAEREAVLSQFGASNLRIWGPDWGRRCGRSSLARRAWQGRALRGVEFARATACSKVNLNIIDPTNYPAPNMRFFEILVAGGLQICSPCPEMESEFKDGEHLFYYSDSGALLDLVRSLLSDPSKRRRVAEQGRLLVLEKHTYAHRARHILEILGLSAS